MAAEAVDLATGIRLEQLGPEVIAPAQPASFSVDVPATTVLAPVMGDFRLTWIQKNVVFESAEPVADPASPDIPDPGGVPPGLVFGASLTETVPSEESTGIMHQVKGTIPIGTHATTLPQHVTVQWHICRPLPDVTPPQCDPSAVLTEGTDYLRADASALTSTFVFAPRHVEEFTVGSQVLNGVPAGMATDELLVRASVQVAVGDGTTKTAQLHLPIKVTALALPTLLLLCTRPNFHHTGARRRALLLLTPHDSGLALVMSATDASEVSQHASAQAIESTLDGLRTALVKTASLGGAGLRIAAYLLGLQRAVSLIRAYRSAAGATYVRLRIASLTANGDDGLSWFKEVEFPGDTFEETVSSVLFLGPPSRTAQLFRGQDFMGAQLDLIARAQCYVAVGDLKTSQPLGDPPHGLSESEPTVMVVTAGSSPRYFNDALSSARFSSSGSTFARPKNRATRTRHRTPDARRPRRAFPA